MKPKAKKKYGQHFLIDDHIIASILEAIPSDWSLPILEIGPGAGALTDPLLAFALSRELEYRAFEIDEDKVKLLQKKYPEWKSQFQLIDFLQSPSPWDSFLLIGNFPYNISSQIVFQMVDWKDEIPMMIGMFQKEVGERIAAAEGNKSYGILSIITQAFYDVELLFDVPPEAFVPVPKVDSVVLRCQNNSNRYMVKNASLFLKFVKLGFQQRRKTLRNNFKTVLDAEVLRSSFFDRRAESLSVEEWVDFYKKYRDDQ